MPFTFSPPPTTLDALDDLISSHCSGCKSVNTLISRIHTSNSVKAEPSMVTPMQNFYDVLVRRYANLGDMVETAGDGGKEDWPGQMSHIVDTLYGMTQDHPQTAGSVYGRKMGHIMAAHKKRVGDSSMYVKKDGTLLPSSPVDFTPWPSLGNVLLLRTVGEIFPTSDLVHGVVSPAMAIMGNMLTECRVCKPWDLAKGLMLAATMLEFVEEPKRLVPEVS